MDKLKYWLTRFIGRNPKANVSLLIIGITILLMVVIFSTRPQINKRAPKEYIPAVHFIEALPDVINIPVSARGFFQPEKEVQINSTVSGTVIEITEKFAVGASFKKNDILLRVDPANLEMELHKAKANYEQAHLRELETNANLDAKSSLDKNKNLSDLALGKPQRAVAKANTDAALAVLKLAQHQLESATLRAPFDGKVMLRNVQEFEQIAPGQPIAKIYASDAYIVRLSVTEEQLAFIDIGRADSKNIDVVITHPATHKVFQGYILRSEGYVSQSRLVNLVVRIILPNTIKNDLPLPGTLVEADIAGRSFTHVITIPIKALKSQNTIWVLDENDRLQIKPAIVIYRGPEKAFIQAEIPSGERIIISHIGAITPGMKLRPIVNNSMVDNQDENKIIETDGIDNDVNKALDGNVGETGNK